MSHVRNETREHDLIITTNNVIDCIASRETIFNWNVYLHHGSGVPDTLLEHPLWKLNTSKLIIPKRTLPIGIIRIEFVLRMVHSIVRGVLGRADGFITISPSPAKVFIPGGERRSEDKNGLKTIGADFVDFDAPPGNITNVTWVWFVKKDNESLPFIGITNLTNLQSVVQVDGCFGYGTGLLPFSLSSFEYNSSLITTRQTCHLEVIATKAQRIAKKQQQIEFYPVFPLPKLLMVCKLNCDKVNPVEIVSYEGLSLNMDYTELNFEWQLWSEGNMIDLNGKTLSSHLSRNLVLASGILEGGKYYKLILFAWKKGDKENKGFMETLFKTNDFPRGGECAINPSIGYAVKTPFRLNCAGWIDEDLPITYRVTIDFEIERFMFSGRELNQPIYLPYHHSHNTSSLNLKVYIIDRYGNYNVTTVSVEIHTFEDPMESINKVLKPNGPLLNEILGGNTQTASQLLSSVASVLIHSATEAGNDTDRLKNIAERLEYFIDIAAQIPSQLPEDVLAIAESLVELTAKPDLLSHNTLGQATVVFDKMLNVLLETKNYANVELIEMASMNILGGIGSIMMSSSMHLSKSMSSDSSATGFSTAEAKRITSSLLSSMDKIFNLLRDNLLVGQNYTMLDTPYLALLTGIKSVGELNTTPLGLKDSSFKLPDMQSELNLSSQFQTIVEMFSSKSNPFLWTPTSNAVATDVISLDLGSQSGESLKVGNLTQKIQVVIKNHISESKADTLRVYSSQGHDVSTHRMNVTTNDSSIHGSVHPINCSVPLTLTIRRNEYDCSKDYDYNWTLPRNDILVEIDPYSFFISNVELNRTAAGVYYICVKPMLDGYVRENCSGHLNYTISTFSGSCRYWDGEDDAWKGDGCEVDEHTSPAATYCICDHLTSFGGGMFVAPNPIDFGKALAGFSDLASNPTVFAVIISIFALYLIAVIFARRADLKDIRKAEVTKLPGNDQRDTFSYEITVYTGLNQNAGTTAEVYLRLIGSLGDSEPRLLKDPEVPRFKRGAIDKFLLTSPQSLGSLKEIHIWHNNAGKSPGWFFFRMQVRDCQTQRKWWFVGNRWLAVDEDDGMVERRIKTATRSELTQFNILFINATRRNLFDGHLWLSVYTRPVQSTFTRVQRLSCCLSLLFSTMLSNAMFFEIGGGAQDTTIKLGPIQLSWSLIIIGIQSSIVVMPVNVLLVTIFRKLAPKKQKSKEYKEDAQREPSNVEKGLESEQDEKEEMEEHKDNTKEDSSNTKKKTLLFPYWCIYIAYILCFISCVTCAFFTLLYGFTFGKEKSEKWLSVMAISFFQSVVVIQPFKVFLLGLFFALIIKDPNKEEEDLDADYEQGEESFKDSSLTKENYAKKMALYSKPLKKQQLERARALRLKEKQMLAIIREIVLHFLVVIIVLFVGHGSHDNKSFSYSKRAIDILTDGIPAFTQVHNDHNFWDWTITQLIPNLYPVDDLIGYPYMDIMHNKKTSNMVGVGRLRQLRNKKHTCKVPLIFTGKFEDCTEDYSWSNEETNNFIPGWRPLTNTSLIIEEIKKTPWDYTSAWEIKSFPYFGKMTTYQGGGYIMELGPTNDTAFQTVHELSRNNWIDQYTRAIFTEINIYNVDVNLLCVITLLYEFLPSGNGIPSINVQTIKLYRYLSSVAKAVMGFEVIFIFLVFYWIYRDCKKIAREGKQYWKGFWNVFDSLVTSLSICSVGIYIARLVFINKAINQFHYDRHKYVSFQYVVLLNEVLNFLTACVVMLCSLKFLRLLRFNRKISMLSDTLRYASKMILSFFVMIFIVIFAFCSMTNLIFGSVLEEYRTLIRSMVSLFSMMMGDFHFQDLNDAHRIIGPIMFFFFMVIVQFILVNMFIGILSDSFNMVRTDAAAQSNEYEIVDFMVRKMSSLIGLSNVAIKPDYTWPKTSLEIQVETIDEKTDVIMEYMRNFSDEDLRTALWFESSKFTDKKDKIILFALGMQTRDFENDDLFDVIPVLLTKLDKINKEDLLKMSKKDNLSVMDLSSKYNSHNSLYLSSVAFDIPDNDDSSSMSDGDSDDEDDQSFSEIHVEKRGDKLQEDCKSEENGRSDSQERRKSILKKASF
ncbi:polycystic kidney disease protein 1-like 2 [Actinia tenebrosa]|uniref:Polycystic kidney disease protein 1-like 2 n=1 Tax=Actinia tenebrosa TaxID=6105 RepID=A0A6P8IP29_ACTTE|nr:polycystic kidney disease protein 1-like 2 [Actinia tenebrosa]